MWRKLCFINLPQTILNLKGDHIADIQLLSNSTAGNLPFSPPPPPPFRFLKRRLVLMEPFSYLRCRCGAKGHRELENYSLNALTLKMFVLLTTVAFLRIS